MPTDGQIPQQITEIANYNVVIPIGRMGAWLIDSAGTAVAFEGEMVELAGNRKIVGSFVSRIGDIRESNIDQLHQLSVSVRWPHRAEDWHLLARVGLGVVALDEIDRVLGSAMWFPFGETVATIGMVITSPRLQENGTAQWLVQHIMDQCSDRELRVTAPANVRRFFKSLGFLQTRTITQFQGQATPLTEISPHLRELRELKRGDFDAVVALDSSAFGAERPRLLETLIEESEAFGLFDGETLLGFSLCRQFGRGWVIGPIVASVEEEAMALTARHIEGRERQFLRVDTPFSEGRFADFLITNGLNSAGTVVTMVRPSTKKPEILEEHPITFALASHTLG